MDDFKNNLSAASTFTRLKIAQLKTIFFILSIEEGFVMM